MTVRKRLKPEVIHLRVTTGMKDKLKSEADEKGDTVVGIIEKALAQYFQETPSVLGSLRKLEENQRALEERVAEVEKALSTTKR